jgi:hypothetical protein
LLYCSNAFDKNNFSLYGGGGGGGGGCFLQLRPWQFACKNYDLIIHPMCVRIYLKYNIIGL